MATNRNVREPQAATGQQKSGYRAGLAGKASRQGAHELAVLGLAGPRPDGAMTPACRQAAGEQRAST